MDLIAIDTLDGPILIDTFPPIVPTAADVAAVNAVIAKYASNERHGTHNQKDHGRKGAGSTKGLHEPDGGFTIDTGGRAIRTGWSVAVEGTSKFMSAEQFESDRQGRKEFVAGFLRDARGQGVKAIGGWHDPAPDNPGKAIVLDHVRIFPSNQHALARAFAVANNQKSMANLDAITAGDWDHAIEQTGGTGDRGRILAHGEDTAHHGRVRHPAGRDVGRADRHPGRGDRRRHGRQPGFVDLEATYGLILRHPGHEDQKVHGRRGPLKGWEGMEDVGPKTAEAITKKVEDLWGVPEPEARQIAVDNLVQAAKNGDLANADWYFKEHDELQAMADRNGISLETQVAMVSVTSAQARWGKNKQVADGIAKKLKADDPFDLTQADIDDYNSWVGGRKAGLAQQHIGFAPGRYRPSELPADLAASKTPGMPKLKNTDYVIAATNVYRGQSPDLVIHGPKQRSFFNNLVAPGDARFVTADTWHYEAMGGSRPFSKTIGGETYSHTITDWNTAGAGPKIVKPQDFFQSAPSVKPESYPSNNGVYPWTVSVTKAAAIEFNSQTGLSLSPSQFQAVVWYSVGGGA